MNRVTGPARRTRLAVLGCGSWGSTIATMLAGGGHETRLWGPDQRELGSLRAAGHPPGVPELRLPASVELTADMTAAVSGAEAAVLVVPSGAVEEVCGKLAGIKDAPGLLILASKGLDPRSLRPLSDVISECLPSARVAVVSGPCIAREVAQGIPTSVVAACADAAAAERVQQWFASPTFRVYRQTDVTGVELGGALKNVIAIAAGISDGLGFGANSKSALLTRGLAEMSRFAMALGAEERTIAGLAGLGDLCVTCFSPHSRNRRFGEALGKGSTPEEALAEIGETVEGVPTARAMLDRARREDIGVPVAEAVVRILAGEWKPAEAVERLMTRELKNEFS